MKWYEGKIETASENADMVAALLLDFGIEGIEIIDEFENAQFLMDNQENWDYVDENLMLVQKGNALVKFYLTQDSQVSMDGIGQSLANYGQVIFDLVDDDWSDAWKAHYKPFKIGDKIVIVPAWEEYTPSDGEVVFKIEPGHVFGTGQHQTTALCITALQQHVTQGKTVLDIGCGSGILSIISLLLGAASANAIDIDPSAQKVCIENARLNGILPELDVYKVHTGNILADDALLRKIGSQGRYDIIAANIIADVIIPLVPIVRGLISHSGIFIASGIIKDKLGDVVQELMKHNFVVTKMSIQDEWVALEATYEAQVFCGQPNDNHEQDNTDRSKCQSCSRAAACGR